MGGGGGVVKEKTAVEGRGYKKGVALGIKNKMDFLTRRAEIFFEQKKEKRK